MDLFDPYQSEPFSDAEGAPKFIGKENFPGICFRLDGKCQVYRLTGFEKKDFEFYGEKIPEISLGFPRPENFNDNELYFVRIIEAEQLGFVLAPIMAWRGFPSGSFSFEQLQEIAVRAFQEYAAACGPIREGRIF